MTAELIESTQPGLRAETKDGRPGGAGRPDIESLEGNQMHTQLNSDELLVAIEGLAEFYGTPDKAPVLSPSVDGGWLAHLLVTPQFRGANIFASENGDRALLFARGLTLRDTLLALHDSFVEAAPSYELVKGA